MTTPDPVDPETWARRILDRPDQVHTADPEKLRGLLDEIRGLRARLGEQDAPEPGCERLAEAVDNALMVAELDIVVTRAGAGLGALDGLRALARCLDRAGLIDWRAFIEDES